MAEAEAELKSRILRLLEEDREFRLSVAGLVGFKEVLERLEEHDRRFEEHARILNGLDLKIEALGSRWGIFSEQAFRGVNQSSLSSLPSLSLMRKRRRHSTEFLSSLALR